MKRSQLKNQAHYVVVIAGKKCIAQFNLINPAYDKTGEFGFWYLIGEEEKAPFEWVTKIVRRIIL